MTTGAVVVAAAAVAVLTWFAPTAPTGVTWWDPVLRSGAAVALTLAAARASAPALVVAAALVAPGAGGVAAGVAGAALGLALTGRMGPALRAVVGGAVVASAFRLSWPEAANATAALGVGAGAVLALSGLRRLSPSIRRPVLVGTAVVGVLAGAAAGLGVVAAVQARAHLEAGADSAQAGLAAARRGEAVAAAGALAEARSSFAAGRQELGSWWARPARGVPVVAHQSRALSTLAAAGAEITGAGARLAQASDPRRLRVAAGTVPVDRIAELVAPAEEAAAVLATEGEALAGAAEPWLAPPIRRELDRLLPRVRRAGRDATVAARTARIAPALLGAEGPRRWFLAVQSPSEQRAGGGFIGSFAEIGADGGRLRLDRVGRTADLNNGGARVRRIDGPAEYLARYGRFDPHLLWQNVNMSPDFPTVAGVVAALYPQSGGAPVDGVIGIDPYGLAALLRVVGPVRVADWPAPITADNAVPVLLYEQYVRFPQTADRVDFLGQVTQAVWQRMLGGSFDIVALGRAVGDALDGKHIVLAAVRAPEQEVLADLGVVGAMAPVDDDFLGVVTQNAGGNKIDWFLRRAVEYRVQVDPESGRLEATARITLRNEAPATGLPPYIIGSALKPPPRPGTNSAYLSVYTPWALESATVDGQATGFESERELGRRAYSAFVDIPPGGAVVVELRLVGTRDAAARAGDYRLTVHRHPSVAPDDVTVTVNGREERVALTTDRTWSFPLEAIGPRGR